MPIYEYICPGIQDPSVASTGTTEHIFERIIPMSQGDALQECPIHAGVMCQRSGIPSKSSWQWGKEDVHWSAGIGSNPLGMAGAKKP